MVGDCRGCGNFEAKHLSKNSVGLPNKSIIHITALYNLFLIGGGSCFYSILVDAATVTNDVDTMGMPSMIFVYSE